MSMSALSRRSVLHLAAGATAAGLVSATGCDRAPTPPTNSPPTAIGQPFPRGVRLPSAPAPRPGADSVGVAIVGLGRYALAQIMPAFTAAGRCHIAALVSGNPRKAARVARAYGVPEDAIYSYDTFHRIAEDDRIEGVYIILPSGLHAPWTEQAFAAGKHVLCEKPMALSAAECARMIAAGERADRHLMIGYRCHFEPYNRRAMALMDAEALGAIDHIDTAQTYVMGPTTPAQTWRVNRALAGGGPLEDYGIYGLQAALYLTGETPVEVRATLETPPNDPRFLEIVATTTTEFTFPSGATARCVTSYDAPGRNRVAVRGARGSLVMDPATGYRGNTLTLETDGAREVLTPGESRTQFAAQLDHFAAAIRENAPIRTPGAMGLRDVRLMEAIYAAAAAQRPLALTPDGRVRAT